MPPEITGAYVSCYAKGRSYAEATEKALKKLTDDGLYPEKVLEPIHEMESSSWSEHVKETWPDYSNNLPTQNEFEKAMQSDQVVYGPFGSYSPH